MIEIFKTNIEEAGQAKKVIDLLLDRFPAHKINFDLLDCDKILRVEGKDFCVEEVTALVNEKGFKCMVLV